MSRLALVEAASTRLKVVQVVEGLHRVLVVLLGASLSRTKLAFLLMGVVPLSKPKVEEEVNLTSLP